MGGMHWWRAKHWIQQPRDNAKKTIASNQWYGGRRIQSLSTDGRTLSLCSDAVSRIPTEGRHECDPCGGPNHQCLEPQIIQIDYLWIDNKGSRIRRKMQGVYCRKGPRRQHIFDGCGTGTEGPSPGLDIFEFFQVRRIASGVGRSRTRGPTGRRHRRRWIVRGRQRRRWNVRRHRPGARPRRTCEDHSEGAVDDGRSRRCYAVILRWKAERARRSNIPIQERASAFGDEVQVLRENCVRDRPVSSRTRADHSLVCFVK
mmetsp:Transcript_324/g.778  ORF Transcript_324/g.778 Transcript_324/m.778 type:complete len:258 (-) Transcript_324:56-829(-)